jgi:hypothetical protein
MVSKLKSWGLHKNTNFVIVSVVVLALIVVGVILGIHTSNSGKKPHQVKTYRPNYTYTYESADFSCRQVKAHPTGDETVNYCSGTLKVKVNKTGEIKEYTITDTSHLIKAGNPQDLSTITQLSKDKTKLYLTFFPGSKTALATIGYQSLQ